MNYLAGLRRGGGKKKPGDLICVIEKTRQDPSLEYTLVISIHINANSAQEWNHMEFSDLRHLPRIVTGIFSGFNQPSEEQEVLGNLCNIALNHLYVAYII